MGLYIALLFLTRIPLPYIECDQKQIIRSLPFFPVIGAIIGFLLAALDALLRSYLPDPAMVCLLVVAETVITGGLHIDGFADTMDGLFCGKTKSEKLEVMKDSRLGAYGVMGVVLLFLLKYSALLSIPAEVRSRLLVIFPALSRWMMTWAIILFPYLREKGLGKAFNENKSSLQVVLSTFFSVIIAFAIEGIESLKIIFLTFILGLLFSLYIFSKIGGMTGDTYGAVNEFCEISVLFLYLIFGNKDA